MTQPIPTAHATKAVSQPQPDGSMAQRRAGNAVASKTPDDKTSVVGAMPLNAAQLGLLGIDDGSKTPTNMQSTPAHKFEDPALTRKPDEKLLAKWKETCAIDIDSLTQKVLDGVSIGIPLSEAEIIWVLKAGAAFSLEHPSMVRMEAPVILFGDLHGQFMSAWDWMRTTSFPPSETARYLFLGNYVTRGNMGFQMILFLTLLKMQYPDYLVMLRGNHDHISMCEVYGFKECLKQHSRFSVAIWNALEILLDSLPVACIVSNQVFCVHSGLSPELCDSQSLKILEEIPRPREIPTTGLVNDLLWACPNDDEFRYGWTYPTDSRIRLYGIDVVKRFLARHNLTTMIRSHQPIQDGVLIHDRSDGCLITIFSAPNFFKDVSNKGGVLLLFMDGGRLNIQIVRRHVNVPTEDIYPNLSKSDRDLNEINENEKAKTSGDSFNKTEMTQRLRTDYNGVSSRFDATQRSDLLN